MRVFNQGCLYRVTVSAAEVAQFNRRWPCSSLVGPQSFTFDRRSGDLVDRRGQGDGPEAVALSQDAQHYGRA